MKNYFFAVLGLTFFMTVGAHAEGYSDYKKNLATCTPFTFSYPHPFMKNFIGKKIIKGKISEKCEAEEIMPNNMKMECKFSNACVTSISTSPGDAPNAAAEKCLSDECTLKH